MRSWLLWPLISSCAAVPASERSFDAPPEAVREAVKSSLSGFAEVREEGDTLRTGWSDERPLEEQGVLLGHAYVGQVRHEVTVAGSSVRVRSDLRRRAAAGPRARQWERAEARDAERALLEEIAKKLGRSS